jgi:hypothetical protein
VIYAGDEQLSDQQQNPELYDEGDPIDYPCEECGADAGEECRPYCTGMAGHAGDDEGDER